jgi:hypothetical protein
MHNVDFAYIFFQLKLFKCKKEEELRTVIKRYVNVVSTLFFK